MEIYKFKYERTPISEVVKEVEIEAGSIDMALHLFRKNYGNNTVVFSIELI